MSQCLWDLRGLGGKCVCVARERETGWRKRGVSLVSGMICVVSCDMFASIVSGHAAPLGFARPWWKVRLRGAVPLGSAKHAGVNAACRW